ncbi:MAG: 5'/3'-nucleotidase SurE [Anaerovoracaceae bacterium]|jgi:5'-nucleotidase
MNILVTNDDGIEARGIRRLAEALAAEEDVAVYVAAPDSQRSAASHAITTGGAITLHEVSFPTARRALETSGTPADSVKLGIRFFRSQDIEMDMVYSGINHGSNLGTDTLYSGTVGAAVEGAMNGKPSVAVSVNSHQPTHFDYACELAVRTLRALRRHHPGAVTFNINTPNLPREEILGFRCTHLGPREYDEWFSPRDTAGGTAEYEYRGRPVVYDSHNVDVDVIADQDRYASITPLQYDLTDHAQLAAMKTWEIEE